MYCKRGEVWCFARIYLGPILFLLYINDLPNCLGTTKANLFVDETSLSCKAPNSEELQWKLNKDLVNVHNWLIANKLSLSDTKTEYMIIGSRYLLSNLESNPVITNGQSNINRVTNKKSLGIKNIGEESLV